MKHTKDFEITAIVPDTYLLTAKDGHIITIEEAMANEKLFEIAPELLDISKRILKKLESPSECINTFDQIDLRNIIKKAS